MEYLTKEQILAIEDIKFKDLKVPEWGGTVRVRGLSGTERDAFEASNQVIRGKTAVPNMVNVRARLCARTIVGPDGEPLFSETDVAALGRKSGAALNRVFDAARKLSGLTEADIAELEGNSEPGPSGGSSSASA